MFRRFKVSILFLVICTIWMLFSDQVLAYYLGPLNPVQQRGYDFGFVILMAATLFVLFMERDSSQVNTNEQYRQLFESNPTPLWIYNNNTLRFVRINDAAIACYGYSKETFLKMTIADIRPPEERERLEDALTKNHNFCLTGQWKHCKANQEVIDVSVLSYPVVFDNQRCSLVIATDITDLLEKERQLQEAYQQIKNFNETLQQIAWSNSHEMRKPVCSIISLVSLLKHTDNNQERRQYQNLLETAASELDEVLKHNEKMAGNERAILN
mgnify:FL=1